MLGIVREELDKRAREQRLNEKPGEARERLLLGSLDEAIEVLNTLEPEDRDSSEARESNT